MAYLRRLSVCSCVLLVIAIAACGPSSPHEPDAEPPDATPTIDGTPCVIDPDGEQCNGWDDDCDNRVDEGFLGTGDPCEVGIGLCRREGTTICSTDGTDTVCDAAAGTPGDELCETGADEDCDSFTDEGFDDLGDACTAGTGACVTSGVMICSPDHLSTECSALAGNGVRELCNAIDDDCDGSVDEGYDLGLPCDGGDGDLCIEGVWACNGAGGHTCSDDSGTTDDLCEGSDEDCDPASPDGSEDPGINVLCDGAADSDLCGEGITVCAGGAPVCTDATGSTEDLCGDGDEDCDPASDDGSEDPGLGVSCDGADSDLCLEGAQVCTDGALACTDTTGSEIDLCDGSDEDCDPTSADGAEDPVVGDGCDGGDGDLCQEGVQACSGGGLVCTDATTTTIDLCGGGDDDCDPASDDGSEDPGNGTACDGADSDLCIEGTRSCSGGSLVCSDATDSTIDLCGGGDEDCDGSSGDGSEDPSVGAPCDGGDTDLCVEGVQSCGGGTLACTDATPSTVDLCGGGDQDCDPSSDDGSEDPAVGIACDGGDSDLCIEGAQACDAGTIACTDTTGSTVDLCGGGDEDCDASSVDGAEDPGVGAACDGGDSDLCIEGAQVCTAGAIACTDTSGSTLDLCGGGDQDCDPASGDGSEDPALGVACDGGDTDLCIEGALACPSGSLTCTDTTGSTLDLCGNGDEDCDGSSGDGSEDPQVGAACDGGDTDLCVEGAQVCSGGAIACTDTSGSTVDLCGGGDQDCDPASGDGSEDPALGAGCDGGDSDLCVEGTMACPAGALTCTDTTGSTTDTCGGGDQDCDASSADGSEDPLLGSPCDGGDSDLCIEGARICSGGSLTCNDPTGSTVDLCGNGDEDCDGASGDGSEDPAVNQICDGGDGDVCYEGVTSCPSGSLVCGDGTDTTFEVCNGAGVDENCNGQVDEGFVLNDSPTCNPYFNLGTINGDTGGSVVTDSWFDEEWDIIRINENDNGIDSLRARIDLYSPPGVDFDLYVYCVSCGSYIASSVLGGWGGHTDTVYVKNDDDWLFDDGMNIIIEVRYFSSNRCAYWQLSVTGNVSTGIGQNCDP